MTGKLFMKLSLLAWVVLFFMLFWILLLGWFTEWSWAVSLTADCSPAADKVTGYQLQFGTAAWVDTAAVTTCGTISPLVCAGDQRTFCYDLTALANGPFTVKGRAVNLWGQSNDSLPFSDTKTLPGSPSSLKEIR